MFTKIVLVLLIKNLILQFLEFSRSPRNIASPNQQQFTFDNFFQFLSTDSASNRSAKSITGAALIARLTVMNGALEADYTISHPIRDFPDPIQILPVVLTRNKMETAAKVEKWPLGSNQLLVKSIGIGNFLNLF